VDVIWNSFLLKFVVLNGFIVEAATFLIFTVANDGSSSRSGI